MTPRPTPRAAVTCCALALLAGGCGPELPELEHETEHLRVGTVSAVGLCEGDLAHYEQVLTSVEDLLSTEVRGAVKLYIWDVDEPFDDSGWCEGETLGCHRSGAIYAPPMSIDHELVHAVVDSLGSPAPFWSEGAAEALQTSRTFFGSTAPADNLDLDNPQLSYGTAGHFSRWLYETHGADLYRDLLAARGDALDAFEKTYSLTFEQAQESYFNDAPHIYGGLLACDHPALPTIGELGWAESIEVDCANTDVRSAPEAMGVYRVLEITERGYYELTTTAEFGSIAPCYDQDLEEPVEIGDPGWGDVPPASGGFIRLFSVPGGTPVLDLVPGRYELSVGVLGRAAQTVDLEVRAAPGPVPQTPESGS